MTEGWGAIKTIRCTSEKGDSLWGGGISPPTAFRRGWLDRHFYLRTPTLGGGDGRKKEKTVQGTGIRKKIKLLLS